MCLHWQQMNDCTQSINYQYGFTMHFDSRQVIENMETQYTMRLRWQHSKIQKTVVISVLLSTTDKYTDAQYQTTHAPNTDKTKIPTDKCTVSTLQQLEDNRNLPT